MSGRDIGASVRQRLLNQSRAQARPFQELLQYFAMERFLYRLANSPVADRFVLKGALLLTAWQGPRSRPTMDIDLAAKTSNELDHISEIVRSVCNVRTEPDGIEFDSASIEVARIKRARNSRLKDYYDLALPSRLYPFVGRTLVEAVVATFRHRETALEMEPIGLAETYHADPARSLQWRAFVRRSRFTEQPDDLKKLVLEVRRFAIPLLTAAGEISFNGVPEGLMDNRRRMAKASPRIPAVRSNHAFGGEQRRAHANRLENWLSSGGPPEHLQPG